ncbi:MULTISPECIES: helix-turn-helix transcriptional regulator [Pyrobaculum]|nr:helix-turn-helix transcriptional regulator [Pyrobaculum arsenaticum]MCY0890556.1 helix-turn-helix transcriptional regulator [Pyrobaculum arsenaticum]
MARAKTATSTSDPRRVLLLKLLEEKGMLTQGQLAKLTGFSWGQLQWHLYVLEREGRVKRVVKDGVVYYVPAISQFLLE